jgi:hypothetical protein
MRSGYRVIVKAIPAAADNKHGEQLGERQDVPDLSRRPERFALEMAAATLAVRTRSRDQTDMEHLQAPRRWREGAGERRSR